MENMKKYRRHLNGDQAFNSFVPEPMAEAQITHTEMLDRSVREVEEAMTELKAAASRLSEEQSEQLLRQEAMFSCRLARGEPSFQFGFVQDEDNSTGTDTENLINATRYAVDAMEYLPISARLLKNAHYIICRSEEYEGKYRGEFRTSPVWIGWKTGSLKDAIFVPPAGNDITDAFTDLERYINYDETENVFVRAALIHYQFEMIHPFIDGNGRVGRLLNTLFLMQQGVLERPVLILSEFLFRKAPAYYLELQHVNATGSYDDWVSFYLAALKSSASATLTRIRSAIV